MILRHRDASNVAASDLLAQEDAPAGVADKFDTTIVWTGKQPTLGRCPYLMRIGYRTVLATPECPNTESIPTRWITWRPASNRTAQVYPALCDYYSGSNTSTSCSR